MNLLLNVNLVFITRVAVYLLAFALNIVLARALGPEGRGLYALFLLVAAVTAAGASLGIGLGNIYYLGKGKYSRGVLLGNSHFLVLMVAALTVAVVVALGLAFEPRAFVAGRPYWLYAPAVPLVLHFIIMTTYLQGENRFMAMNAVIAFQSALLTVAAVTLFYVGHLSLFTVLLALMASFAAADLLALAMVRAWALGASLRPRWQALRDQLSYGAKGQAANLAQLFNYRLDVLLVAAFASSADVGYYAVAVGLSETIWWVANSVSAVLMPRLTRLEGRDAAYLTALACRNTLLLSAVAAVALALVAPPAVTALFGGEFRPVVTPIYWLLPGIVALSGGKVITAYIFSQGRVILNTYNTIIALALTLILDAVLIPRFGVTGAAIAASAAYILSLGISLFWYRRVFGQKVGELLLPKGRDLQLYLGAVRRLGARYVPMGRTGA
ncbi:MAG: oligosaccharide flippase family protein [Dehalococcoidia bacterium]